MTESVKKSSPEIRRGPGGSVPSPCVSICALDEDDYCQGCYRSADEIRRWMQLDDEQRRQVIQKAAEREKNRNPFV